MIPGGYKVLDANASLSLTSLLTMDEARHIASSIAKLPKLLGIG